jgi:hypothetical protein
MDTNRQHYARPASTWLAWFAACAVIICAPLAAAQAPAASGNAAEAPSPEELDKLVGPIALYPDDLVAIILPASTNPLQLVQADRFLDKRKSDPKLAIDENWDDSVKALINYPEVVKQMSTDLDWTADLGEAVVADQGAVLDAVQAFRRKAQGAGNLKTDSKQVVEVEKEVIKIVPADPQVIYVPQYNPSTVVVYSAAPVYGYWPSPYPVYYYPYPPGAAFASGLIWGAAIGAAWNGGHWNTNWGGGNNNITINRGDVNINRGNINTGDINRPSQRPAGGGTAWKSDKQPGQVSSGAGRPTRTSARVGDASAGGFGGNAGARTSTQPAGGMGQGGGRNQPGATTTSGAATRTGTSRGTVGGGRCGSGGYGSGNAARAGGGDAFGGYGSGNAARADSSRGAASRSSMSGGSARQMPSGGGARGGGGAARGGGGRGGRR